MTRGYKGQLFSLFVPLFTLPTQQDCVLPGHDWPKEQIPCHSSFSDGIIRSLHQGSFAVQFGDHLQRCTDLSKHLITA